MDFIEYILSEFYDTINKNYPDKKKRTIEDYIAIFADYPPILEKLCSRKCPMEAEAHRVRGNEIYMTGNYEEAAIIYTNSIKKAPAYSKCAALAYANRSAALYHLKLWEDCIMDIERALNLPYPDDLRAKMMSRKETALNNLREDKKAQKTNDTDTDTNKNNSKSNKKDSNSYKEPVKDLKYGENPKLTGASHGINIVHDPQKGTKLFATKPFEMGDILIIEKPYLAVPVYEEDLVSCYHCLKKSLSLIPCDRCSEAVYCTEKCRGDAYDNYHRIECKIRSKLTSSFPLDIQRLFCQLDKELDKDFEKLEEENTDPSALDFTGHQFIRNRVKGILSSWNSLEFKHDSEAFFAAGYIVTLLRNYTIFFKSNSDVHIVAKFLVILSYTYMFNHVPVPRFGEDETRAYATFPLFCLAKHACVNNTVTYIDEDAKMVLRASQYIRPGDEILFGYRNLLFSFEESSIRTGQKIQCKRICKTCEKTYVYPSERQPRIEMDKGLRSKIQKNPYDINGLWRILNLMRVRHRHYTLQAQIIKAMLVEAYEGRVDIVLGYARLRMVGIL